MNVGYVKVQVVFIQYKKFVSVGYLKRASDFLDHALGFWSMAFGR